MEHTQGEWIAVPNKSWGEAHKANFGDKSGFVICTGRRLIAHATVFNAFGEKDCTKANSKLIAAAPDMLEACKLALVVLRGLDSSALVIPILEETINKATV